MMSAVPDSGARIYFKTELLCASSFIDDVIWHWEKSAGRLTGADAELIQLIRQKQQEWEQAAGKNESRPASQSDTPSSAPQTPYSKFILGPRYATPQMLTDGDLSFEGPMYGQILSQTGTESRVVEEVAAALSGSIRNGHHGAEDASGNGRMKRGYEGVHDSGNRGLSGSDVEVEGKRGAHGSDFKGQRWSSVAQINVSGSHKDGGRDKSEEARENGGSNENGRSTEHRTGRENGGSNDNGGTPESGGQKERRRQRLERKRKKETGKGMGTDDKLFGPRVGFGAQPPTENHNVPEPEVAPEGSHRDERVLGKSRELGEGRKPGGMWAEEGEGGASGSPREGHVADDVMDYFSGPDLEPVTNHTEADFPALGGGVGPPAGATPLKRFTALKRPGSEVDDVRGRGSSWAKLIGSKASEKDTGEGVSDVRNDEAFLEFERMRVAFEEEDRRKRRKMRSKDDFECVERVRGKMVNTVQGLVLHENVLDEGEQSAVIRMIKELERLGNEGRLRGRTFTAPRKWMRGKGRVTIQFGCCYNYAVDFKGRPPGILQDEAVEPMPAFLEDIIDRMVRWKVMPGGKKRPDSAIVNLYSEGDCIPIHIDHHDFDRPFCTISLQSVAPIKFGAFMESLDAGQFSGAFELPLPTGSVCILNGNAADVAKHCIPSVPAPRISITFRRMRPEKSPYINTVLPAPDHSVFHARAFSPSLIPPSLGPPQIETSRSKPASEAARSTPPLDVSNEAWPDLSGKPSGGKPSEGLVEAGEKQRSGSPAWATNPTTRPPPDRPSEPHQSVRPLLPRPLLARGSDSARGADWPELGAGGKGRSNQRSTSTEKSGNGAEREEPLPLRPVSVAGKDQSREPGTWEDRRRIGRSRSRPASPVRTIRRSTSRPVSPARTIGLSTSRPASPSVTPSATDAGRLVLDDPSAKVSTPARVPETETANQSRLSGNQLQEPLNSEIAPSGKEPTTSPGPELKPKSKRDPDANPNPALGPADSDARAVKASGLRERSTGPNAADAYDSSDGREKSRVEPVSGNAERGQVSRPDWSSQTDSPAEKGSKGSRGSPPGFKVPVQGERFGSGETRDGARGLSPAGAHRPESGSDATGETGKQRGGTEAAKEDSPVSGNRDINRPVEWRRERRTTEPQRGLSPSQRYDERGAIAYGRYEETGVRAYKQGRRDHGFSEQRGGSERRFSPEPNQERNSTGRNGAERNSTERKGAGRDGPERNGTGRDGPERNGNERNGEERNGTQRDGTGRDGSELNRYERNAAERNGAERNGAERNGTERNGPERNGWGRRGSFEQSGVASNRFPSQGRIENAYPGPAQIDRDWRPGSRSGGLTSAAEEYRRGTCGQNTSPGNGVYGGVSSAGYAYPGTESNQELLATAPEFVPQSNVGSKPAGYSHQGSPLGSGSDGAHLHRPGSNGSGSDTSRTRGSASGPNPNYSGSKGFDNGVGYQQPGPNGTANGEYSHQLERDSRRASPGISSSVQEGRLRESPATGRVGTSSGEQAIAGNGSDMQQARVARVDATCVFDKLSDEAGSRPLDARPDGASKAELPAPFTSPAAPFARFFPKETPKKTPQY